MREGLLFLYAIMLTVVLILCSTFLSTDAVAFGNAHFGPGTGPILLDNLDCSGSESGLIDCLQSSYISCYCGHAEDAGVRCQGAAVIFSIRDLLHESDITGIFIFIWQRD